MSLLLYLISINVTNIVLVMLPIWANDVMDNCREDVFIFIRQLLWSAKVLFGSVENKPFKRRKESGQFVPWVVTHSRRRLECFYSCALSILLLHFMSVHVVLMMVILPRLSCEPSCTGWRLCHRNHHGMISAHITKKRKKGVAERIVEKDVKTRVDGAVGMSYPSK